MSTLTSNFSHVERGSSREQIALAEAEALRRSGALVEDARRERPRYFDGRFLAARDLIKDQQYFLAREADLGRATGAGVATGLHVRRGSGPSQLQVGLGQGVTPAGELVLLPRDLDLNLADLALAEQLSARFGLGRVPAAPLRSRTGLFVLALRPVEYTANPIGAYPTTLTGPRTVEDGDVIEATAVTLVPWQDDGAADKLDLRRSRAARAIFTQGGELGVSSGLLPLAMLALDGNLLRWIDEAMVRRELGADRGDLPGLGFAPRGLRLAHLAQHSVHLDDVAAQFQGRSFTAASQFQALPPAGPLPPSIIDTDSFTQRYFPSEVDVDFSIIPEDELPALVEESLALPPIDLLGAEATLDRTAVLVLAPVPRAQWREVAQRLDDRPRSLRPAPPNLVAQRKPLEILMRLRLPLPTPPLTPADSEWVRLARLPRLWYVRRRNLAYRDDLAGTPLPVAAGNEGAAVQLLRTRLQDQGLGEALTRVLANATPQAATRVLGMLAAPRVAASPTLTAATLGALSARTGSATVLEQSTVLSVASDLAGSGVGDGLVRLESKAVTPVTAAALRDIAASDAWRKLDATAAAAPAAGVPRLVERLVPHKPIVAEPAPAAPAPRTAAKNTGAAAKKGSAAAKKADAAAVAPPAPAAPDSPAASARAAAQRRRGAAKKSPT
ncbi:hypothetical protein BurJ1DRAFT_2329 [Burkholderiales bacterium JOSHI_001]|nr:hypothetical protein BurJ1DRAFT_2329 [Burkholderiales bacterium JOSHI_001]